LGIDFIYPATQLPEAPFGAAWAGWIPDWQCQHHPDLFSKDERARRYLQYRELARRPVSCLFSSQQALEDTRRLNLETESTVWKVFRFPAVFDDTAWERTHAAISETRKRFGIPPSYLIVCNQFWRHKNHLVIVEALAKRPDLDVHVVMTGAIEDTRWPDYAARIRELLSDPSVARRITLTDSISRQDQLDLLFGASAYVQPSRFEGWSTFVEEARALGLPGLLSDIPVHREQSPDGCRFFDPSNADELAECLNLFSLNLPQRPTLQSARSKHADYTAGCARTFMEIARDAQTRYDPAQHDTVTLLAKAIPDVFDGIETSERYGREDFDRWLANLRLSLRDHPEDLAKLAGRLVRDGSAFAPHVDQLLVKATLAKCPPDIRQRFQDFDPESDSQDPVTEIREIQNDVAKPEAQAQMIFRNAVFRVRDYVRRKLTT
jgi:glycosyltransferase involved in cell wall biosynthesis